MKQRIVASRLASGEQGKYVLYWMQQAQRLHFNPALDFAVEAAGQRAQPLLIAFVLTGGIAQAQSRHYRFMLEGISELADSLCDAGVDFRIYTGEPVEIIAALAHDASLLVLDHGYLNWQRAWRRELFDRLTETSIVELDTEAVVPVHIASGKEEYSAATLRTKLLKFLPDNLNFESTELKSLGMAATTAMHFCRFEGNPAQFNPLWDFGKRALGLSEDGVHAAFPGGYRAARLKLTEFKMHKLQHYARYRNHPERDIQSELSPYLHFGQISALDIIQRLKDDADGFALRSLIAQRKSLDLPELNLADFLEELIVRRELSMNFCTYNPDYDSFACLPAWAKGTLMNHIHDARERLYSIAELENADTEDIYWNAAQRQMVDTGKMHNYMRMYWGKRVLAWCDSVEEAYELLLYLNNSYELDGRGANAYAGVAWCFGKHDRPWGERAIYGMVRYMNAAGLKRKFDMPAYLDKVARGG